MRVTFVLPHATPSGGVRVVLAYARRLMARGHEVLTVLQPPTRPTIRDWARALSRGRLPQGPTPHGTLLPDGVVPHVMLDRPRWVTDADLPDADVVVATWWETAGGVARLGRRKGAPVYLVQHDETVFYPHDARLAGRVRETWRLPMRRVAVSSWIARRMRDGGCDGAISVVANGVDLAEFDGRPRGKRDRFTLGAMHSFMAFKGPETLVDAVRAARGRIPGLRVVGFGVDQAPAGLFDEYHPNPPRGVVARVYASCDAWLFTSREEGFGLPILEAMASGTPVLGTRTGAAEDVIPDGGGEVVEIGDAEGLAAAAARFAALDDAAWRARSALARRVAETRDLDRVADEFERELRLACGGVATPGPKVVPTR